MFGYQVAAIVATFLVLIKVSQTSKLSAIPTVGSSGLLGSWWTGFKFLTNGLDLIQEGYEKYKPAPFKVAELHRWIIILSSRELLDELRKAPEDTLSFMETVNESFQGEYTLGPEIHHNPYHITIMRSQLTRSIGVLYPEIRDEVVTAFDDVLDLKGNGWKSVPALSSIQKVVCRASNIIFVGLPLCRHPEWIDLNIQYAFNVIRGGVIIRLFPDLLKPIVSWFCTSVRQTNLRGRKLLGPMIDERRENLNQYGNGWVGKPNDFLSWLIDEAEGPESTVEFLTNRMLTVNFSAIHTTSVSFTHALFYLAANPQYIQPLRNEVESIVKKEGWSKDSLDKMHKVDSFLKECQRLEGIGGLSLMRKALKDYTFSDGTFVPQGTWVSAASRPIHLDDAFYKNAHEFEPFRFSDLRDEDGEGMKHQFVTTTTEYLPFGHGRNACPGRFFAVNELKSMLAHVVVTYDVKLPDNTARPKTLHLGTVLLPDPSAEVLFRRRAE